MICLVRRKAMLLVRWPLGAVGWLAACSSNAAHGESNTTHDDAVLTVVCSCSAVRSQSLADNLICFALLCATVLSLFPCYCCTALAVTTHRIA